MSNQRYPHMLEPLDLGFTTLKNRLTTLIANINLQIQSP